jgi:hypothetical protein|tara:strand:+ start:8590 stop:9300 length:711 start_codon:yes stop_codon:yes gene_type:complete
MYSIIISYRDRESHLEMLLPRLEELFDSKDYEIIIAEQDNNEKFQKNSLYNLAAVRAKGDIFIFHDVDYYPVEDISYDTKVDVPFYPVGKVLFLNENNQPRKIEDIPAGYRNFHVTVGDHSGGVFVLSKELFFKTNGLNPFFKGWGKEDDATRDRLRFLGYNWKRNNKALFYALYHKDSKPDDNDNDFVNNNKLYMNLTSDTEVGLNNVNGKVEEFDMPDHSNVRWLKIKDFEYKS